LLTKYCSHRTEISIKDIVTLGSVAIQGLSVELKIIPPGCTGLVQPIDVGINKPFKANMRKIYTEWLLKQVRTLPFHLLLA
jgi:hypothetical protein